MRNKIQKGNDSLTTRGLGPDAEQRADRPSSTAADCGVVLLASWSRKPVSRLRWRAAAADSCRLIALRAHKSRLLTQIIGNQFVFGFRKICCSPAADQTTISHNRHRKESVLVTLVGPWVSYQIRGLLLPSTKYVLVILSWRECSAVVSSSRICLDCRPKRSFQGRFVCWLIVKIQRPMPWVKELDTSRAYFRCNFSRCWPIFTATLC